MTSSRRPARGRSRLGVLAGLLLLTIPGFALGSLAGLLWEDPGLVAAYVFGRTQVVALAPGAQPEAVAQLEETPPDDVALPAVAAAPARPVAVPEAPRREAALKPTPHAAAGGRVAIQVGAFGEKSAADQLADSLRDKGYPVYVAAGEASGSARWRVRVGPLRTREEGEREAARLKREERLPTWVLEEDP